jgi:glycosyltransferase involved in cell wall biosynthesis
MATGAPVVVTDGGALPEVVGDAGVIVPAGDPEALRLAITDLLDDPARRRRLGAAAAARAEARFSWERVAERYEEILVEAAGRPC